jgi:hypothetical protein
VNRGFDRLTPEMERQFRRELDERLAEARQLRGDLSREGRDVSELDEVIRDLEALDNLGDWTSPRGVEQLQAAIVDGAKRFEYDLRRQLLGEEKEQLFLSGSGEVPEGYRQLVEEYYKALSRRRN